MPYNIKDPTLYTKNKLEFYVWDGTKQVIIDSISDVLGGVMGSYDLSSTGNVTSINIDIDDNLKQVGITQGKFIVEYFLFRPIANFIIQEISTTRKEMRVRPLLITAGTDIEGYKALITYRPVCGFTDANGNRVIARNELVANFGDHRHICVTNWLTDAEASGETPPVCNDDILTDAVGVDTFFITRVDFDDPENGWNSIILKTYDPIPPDITVKTTFRLDLSFIEPIEKSVILYPFPDYEKCRILRSPNWSSISSPDRPIR